ncbi:adenosylcobinamide-GDP ribazoletransferase [Xanthobacter sp. TB0136]|uniref:adenosylcobinamide-GDP ribazoletransferase n=1 Tax=Xanthobacter sp. TB0136 TaxID=3459177 RepID=UPI0040396CAC
MLAGPAWPHSTPPDHGPDMTLDRIAQDLFSALRFYSRLPTPAPADAAELWAAPDMDRIAYAIPLAGAVMGLLGGAVLVLAAWAGLPEFLCATLAFTILVLASGAMHEDGLADTADGWGGGRDAEHRLMIMRDSRLGTFGVTALILSLLLRIGAVMALMAAFSPIQAAFALVAACAASRATGILMLRALPSARKDGASATFGQPSHKAALSCALMAAFIAALLLVPLFGLAAAVSGLALCIAVIYMMAGISRRMLGGQTGDVAGATQQISEIAFLLAVLILA